MSDDKNSTEIDQVSCEICMKELPRSEAKSEEASDYFLYFCGLDCYDKWQKENVNKAKASTEK